MEEGCLRRRMLLCCGLYRVGRSYAWHLPVYGRFEEERMHLAVIMEVPLGMCRIARKRQLCFSSMIFGRCKLSLAKNFLPLRAKLAGTASAQMLMEI